MVTNLASSPVRPTEPDWVAWWQRFEDQQTFHAPRREQRFALMLELVSEISQGAPTSVLDLACGTGAISVRVLRRFPDTHVVALDVDPLLMAIGQNTLGDADGRLTWIKADLPLGQLDRRTAGSGAI